MSTNLIRFEQVNKDFQKCIGYLQNKALHTKVDDLPAEDANNKSSDLHSSENFRNVTSRRLRTTPVAILNL